MKHRCAVLGLTCAKQRAKLWICFKLICSVKYVQKESIWQEIDLFQLKLFQKDPATVNLGKLARWQKPTPNFEFGWNWLILAKKCRKKTQRNNALVSLSSKLRKTAIGTVNLPKLACLSKTSITHRCIVLCENCTKQCLQLWLCLKLRFFFVKKRTESVNLTRKLPIWACGNVNLLKLARFIKNK